MCFRNPVRPPVGWMMGSTADTALIAAVLWPGSIWRDHLKKCQQYTEKSTGQQWTSAESYSFVAYWPLEVLTCPTTYNQPPPSPAVLLGVVTSFWTNSISANNEIDYWVVSASVVSLQEYSSVRRYCEKSLCRHHAAPLGPTNAILATKRWIRNRFLIAFLIRFKCVWHLPQSVCPECRSPSTIPSMGDPSVHHQFTSFSAHFQCN